MKSFLILLIFIFLSGFIYSQTEIWVGQTYESSVSVGELCYYTGTQWDEADASASATSYKKIGIALGNGQILLRGIWKTTGLTPGDVYYISTTAGQITNTKPAVTTNQVRRIGEAKSATQLSLDVDGTWVEVP